MWQHSSPLGRFSQIAKFEHHKELAIGKLYPIGEATGGQRENT